MRVDVTLWDGDAGSLSFTYDEGTDLLVILEWYTLLPGADWRACETAKRLVPTLRDALKDPRRPGPPTGYAAMPPGGTPPVLPDPTETFRTG